MAPMVRPWSAFRARGGTRLATEGVNDEEKKKKGLAMTTSWQGAAAIAALVAGPLLHYYRTANGQSGSAKSPMHRPLQLSRRP